MKDQPGGETGGASIEQGPSTKSPSTNQSGRPAQTDNVSALLEFARQQEAQRQQLLKGADNVSAVLEFARQQEAQRQQLLKGADNVSALLDFLREHPEPSWRTAARTGRAETFDAKVASRVFEAAREGYNTLSAVRSLHYPSLKNVDGDGTTVYSPEMTKSSTYLEQSELELNSFDEFQRESSKLMENHPEFNFLWRGQRDADWALHSSLFRELWRIKGVRAPDQKHRSEEPFPTESDMVDAELRILQFVRDQWRFDDAGAMTTFARLQHFGAPTRLLDVSRNPLIAAWFATETNEETDDDDCRIFALATSTLPGDSAERSRQVESTRIGSSDANQSLPFWHALENNEVRAEKQWGTGRLRRYWIPPLYEGRIAAQNAGFILDGVPLSSPDLDKFFLKANSKTPWKLADRLASGSISARFSHAGKRVGRRLARQLPPSFTFRITAKAKHEIRRILDNRYSYNQATIYPDIQGAAQAISGNLTALLKETS